MTLAMITFLVLTTAIILSGAASVIAKQETTEDYLLAGRSVPGWLAALSTVATNNSGFMFIGMIAATYRGGVETVWMMVGWLIGDWLAWQRVYPRLRARSGASGTVTLTAILATGPEGPRRKLVVMASVLTFVLLGTYAAAQLKAGSTALQALFGWDAALGVWIGAGIVIVYSMAGGLRADIWTDAAQSVVMIAAIGLVLAAGIERVGGPGAVWANLSAQDPALVTWVPDDLRFGLGLFLLGFVAAGLGSVGQPHLMTRILAMDHTSSIRRARVYYFVYFVPFWAACLVVGLYARAILPDLGALAGAPGLPDPTELALPALAVELLPQIFVGLTLAGIFAATVSTADSQIILCAGVITQDMAPRWRSSYVATKLATLAVLGFGLVIALWAPETVFALVLVSWSGLGATLGPVLLVRLWRWPLPDGAGVAMMTAGLIAVIAWQAAGLSAHVFAILPGAVASFAVYGAARAAGLVRRSSGRWRPRQESNL